MSKVDLDEAKKLMAEAAAWKPNEDAIVDSVMSASFLLMGAEQYIKQMADELALARAVVEAAGPQLQMYLEDYGHGKVEDWSEALENELGWGKSIPVRLGRALAAYRAHVGGKDG